MWLICKFIVGSANARRLDAMRCAASHKIHAMRFVPKYFKRAKTLGTELYFWRLVSRGTALGLAIFASSALLLPEAHAVDNDSIPPSALGRIEKNLRDFGQKARDAASEITSTALGLVGVDYKFGGNHPDQGLDCSGFVRYVFQQATGISLPRSSKEQARVGQKIDRTQLQPGDLVFFNTRRFQFSHVGVYLGDNKFIHSPSRGGSVEVVNLDNRYWQKAFNGARRIVGVVAGNEAHAATLRDTAKVEDELKTQREQPLKTAVVETAVKQPASATISSPFTRDY
jgi:cell wall-associated NlpC family hydrolase